MKEEREEIEREYERIAQMRPSGEAEGLVKNVIVLVEELSTKTQELQALLLTPHH